MRRRGQGRGWAAMLAGAYATWFVGLPLVLAGLIWGMKAFVALICFVGTCS